MTQRLSNSGRRYAEGSHSTRADWYPRDCYVCGERVLISKPVGGACFYQDDTTGEAFAWHGTCASGPPPKKVAA